MLRDIDRKENFDYHPQILTIFVFWKTKSLQKNHKNYHILFPINTIKKQFHIFCWLTFRDHLKIA